MSPTVRHKLGVHDEKELNVDMPDTRLSPPERTLRARLAAHTSWANTSDPTARTAPAREKFLERFYDSVDKDRTLSEAERERRAKHARKAYFLALSLKAAQARRQRALTPDNQHSPKVTE